MTPADLRLPGALFLTVLGLQAGGFAETPYRRRLQALRGWVLALERVESEIRHGRRDLEQALRLAAQDAPETVAAALGQFAEGTGELLSTAALWERALACDEDLRAEDRAVLAVLGPVLGRYAPEEQGRHLAAVRQTLGRLERDADSALKSRGRAVRVLLGLCGAAIAILVV